jgi:predicted nucleotidyltransferase
MLSKMHLTEICPRYGIDVLYVFGSRAKEIAGLISGQEKAASHPMSDVDIGILPKSERRLNVRDKAHLMADLEDLLEVGRVDLVVLSEASAFLALEVIQGEILYEIDPDRTAEYELYVMRRAGDLALFERERVEQILTQKAL